MEGCQAGKIYMAAKCFFCGKTINAGEGKMAVKASGDIIRLCSSKCEKNWEKGRQGKRTKWTKKFEKGGK